MGMIYKRGGVYWLKYYQNGKPIFESSHSAKQADAARLLKRREADIAEGKRPGVYFERVKFEELAEDFLDDYRVNGRKSLVRAQESVNTLKRWFGSRPAPEITTSKINSFIKDRLETGVSRATVNRELAALKRMLNLGAKATPRKVDVVPYIPTLKENNVRKGFFEHGEFVALREALPRYLRDFVTFAYRTGWRCAEVAGLTWSQVDLQQGVVRLEPGETKNDDGRTVYLDKELTRLVAEQWKARKRNRRLLPYVFLNEGGDDRIKRFDKAWATACKKAALQGKLFHDLRRTAVRNMVRSGIPERVSMMISGHKSRSVFERYNIVSGDDLKVAAAKQEAYIESLTVTKMVTVGDFQQKKASSRQR